MTGIDPAHLATIVRKLRRSRVTDLECLIAYLVCEVADTLPQAERNEWHDRCQVTNS